MFALLLNHVVVVVFAKLNALCVVLLPMMLTTAVASDNEPICLSAGLYS